MNSMIFLSSKLSRTLKKNRWTSCKWRRECTDVRKISKNWEILKPACRWQKNSKLTNVDSENAIQRARRRRTWSRCRKWDTFSFFIKFMRFSECCDRRCSSSKKTFWLMKWIWAKYDESHTFKNKLIHIRSQLFSLFLLYLDDSRSQRKM